MNERHELDFCFYEVFAGHLSLKPRCIRFNHSQKDHAASLDYWWLRFFVARYQTDLDWHFTERADAEEFRYAARRRNGEI